MSAIEEGVGCGELSDEFERFERSETPRERPANTLNSSRTFWESTSLV